MEFLSHCMLIEDNAVQTAVGEMDGHAGQAALFVACPPMNKRAVSWISNNVVLFKPRGCIDHVHDLMQCIKSTYTCR